MTMEGHNSILPSPKRTPWNKGKLIGAKPPLLARHVWSIRTRLQIEKRTRDLAMFNLAIDSKLRGCDVVALRVEDVAPNGYALSRATVRQRKTGRSVRFELTEQTRQTVDDYLKAAVAVSPVRDGAPATAGAARSVLYFRKAHFVIGVTARMRARP
jgi:integrase